MRNYRNTHFYFGEMNKFSRKDFDTGDSMPTFQRILSQASFRQDYSLVHQRAFEIQIEINGDVLRQQSLFVANEFVKNKVKLLLKIIQTKNNQSPRCFRVRGLFFLLRCSNLEFLEFLLPIYLCSTRVLVSNRFVFKNKFWYLVRIAV